MANCIRVDQLPESATAELLQSFFAFHGKIDEVVVRDSVGYLQFSDSAAAQSALLFDKSNFLGNAISVELSDKDIPEDVPAADAKNSAVEASAMSTSTPARAESVPTTARVSIVSGGPETAPESSPSETSAALSADGAVEVSSNEGSDAFAFPENEMDEAFERVEREDVGMFADDDTTAKGIKQAASGDDLATGGTLPTPAAAHAASLSSDRFACFRQLATEPLNSPNMLAAVTFASFLSLAIW